MLPLVPRTLSRYQFQALAAVLVASSLSVGCGDKAALKTPQEIGVADGLVRDIAVDESYAYWTNAGGEDVLFRTKRTSPSEDALAASDGTPYLLQLLANDLYFTTAGGTGTAGGEKNAIWRVPLTGGEEVEVAGTDDDITALAVDDDGLVYATRAGALFITDPDGSTLELVSGRGYIPDIKIDDRVIFFLDATSGELLQTTRQGGKLVTVADGLLQPRALAAADGQVFVAAGVADESVGGYVAKVNAATNSVSRLATEQSIAGGADLVYHDGHVYWFRVDGSTTFVVRVAEGGGEVEDMARVEASGPTGLCVDDRGMVWSVTDGPTSKILEAKF
jgi:hypothetical protein